MKKTINYLADLLLNLILLIFSICIIKMNVYVFFNDLFSWIQIASLILMIKVVVLVCSSTVKSEEINKS